MSGAWPAGDSDRARASSSRFGIREKAGLPAETVLRGLPALGEGRVKGRLRRGGTAGLPPGPCGPDDRYVPPELPVLADPSQSRLSAKALLLRIANLARWRRIEG